LAERKPPGRSWDSWSEQLIREAQENGAFADLPKGKAIPDLDRPYDPLWWVRKWIEREKLSVLPPALDLRRKVEREIERIWTMTSEHQVREKIEALNCEIARMNARATGGPPTSLGCLDVERIVARWRERRSGV
jgi:hypothetical protein